jgi:hypothetical protein
MNELYFTGMDIVEETKEFMNLSESICIDGMTENELRAYHMGVENVLSALKSIIDESDLPVLNINGLEIQTELSIEDLEEHYGTM